MKRLTSAMAGAAIAMLLPVAAFSAGDGGGTSDNQTAEQCPTGKVWDKKKQKCVRAETSLPQDMIYEGGYDLAMAGRYEDAIRLLSLAPDKNDPRVLNYLGYSHRKAGRVQVGLGYYEEALRANPDYVLAREYMGEAYLTIGDVASAKGQLDEIARRAGTSSAEFARLAGLIAAAG
ncbi:MAG: tetratricopeptide repeat protein [Phyllobacteriaceae bacterium]|nr:tetratricopeptide repeat protein [Phyllobacteriaceae bacterium]